MQLIKEKWYYFILGLLLLIIILSEARINGDFDIFMSASSDLLKGKNIYAETYKEWYHYYYSVFFSLILSPFTFLPLYFVKVLWLIANVFFVYRIWKIITSLLPLDLLSKKVRTIFVVLALLFVIKFLRDNFHVAQVTILILFLSLEGLRFIWNDKPFLGALLIALGIDIKLLPLVFLPYLMYRREWKALFFCVVILVILALTPALIVGFEYNQFLLAERWKLLNPSNTAHVLDTSERSFHSLTTVLATLLVENTGDHLALPIKRNIADISLDQLARIILIFRLFFVGFTLYFLRSFPFQKMYNPVQRLYEVSYICLIIPLIFPHQQHYAFFFVFPASTYVLHYLILNYYCIDPSSNKQIFLRKKWAFTISTVIVFLLLNSHFILGTFNTYYDHFKTLTYGVLFLLILLTFFTPKKLSYIVLN
jgi:hypothetical protein